MQYMLIITMDENAPGPAEGTAEYDADARAGSTTRGTCCRAARW